MVAWWASWHDRPWLYWVPIAVYAGLIFYLSSLPYPAKELPSLFGQLNDKLVHVVEYGVFAILLYRACRWAAGAWGAERAWWLAIVGAVFYGLTDELHQSFVPPRMADHWDVVADALGAVLFSTLWRKVTESPLMVRFNATGR